MIKHLFTLVIVVGIVGAIWFMGVLNSGSGTHETKSFIIKSGQGVNAISAALNEVGLIDSKFVFETWVWLKRSEFRLQAGIYEIPADISITDLLDVLLGGADNDQKAITIVDGWSRQWPKLKETLLANGFSYDIWLDLSSHASDWQSDYDFLADAPANASLEGYLYPNTHFINSDTTEEDLINKLLSDFGKKLKPDLREEIARQDKTIFEVITLASIIEREVPQDTDKKMIADIFQKRLKASIGLQSDATVNFVTGKGLAQPTLEDLDVDSPYNTYKYRGLPPGPIASPGLASIEAVIYPTANDFYYFLTALDDGEVIYGVTYEDHLANKAKYLD